MAKAKNAKRISHPKKVIQEFLPDMAPQKNKRVHPLALAYAELRDARIAANKEEKGAHDTLLYTMIEEGLESYHYGDLQVTIDSHRKCKVKIGAESSANGEDDGNSGS